MKLTSVDINLLKEMIRVRYISFTIFSLLFVSGIVTNASAQCRSSFTNYVLNPKGAICGATISFILSGSQTDVTYQLMQYGEAIGTAKAGTGAAITFNPVTFFDGPYYVVARNANASCTNFQTVGNANVTFVDGATGNIASSTPKLPDGGAVTLSANITNYKYTIAYTYNWVKPDGETAITPTIQATTQGVYSLTIFDGCKSVTWSYTLKMADAIPKLYSTNKNYIVTYTPQVGGLNNQTSLYTQTAQDVKAEITYFDGMGRQEQSIHIKGSPGLKDFVQPFSYDIYGRQEKHYLPYAETTDDGLFKTSALLTGEGVFKFYNPYGSSGLQLPGAIARIPEPFAESKFEDSDLNRVTEQGAPGSIWQLSSGHTTKQFQGSNDAISINTGSGLWARQYEVNAANVLEDKGDYGLNQLYVTVSKDENWSATQTDTKAGIIEKYVDKEGKTVLTRRYESSTKPLSTYYVYNDLGYLVFVLTPGSNPDAGGTISQATLDSYCYQYKYDNRGRVVEKQTPGKGLEYVVYNKLNQVVAIQDAKQRETNQWLFLKYDELGRVIIRGITTQSNRIDFQFLINEQTGNWESRDNSNNGGSATGYTDISLPAHANIVTYLSVNYYDDYSFYGSPSSAPYNAHGNYTDRTTGLLTAVKTNVLGTSHMLWNVNYYNSEGQIVRAIQQHYKNASSNLNNYDDISTNYSFIGAHTNSSRKHYVLGTQHLYISSRYLYDHSGRKTHVYQKTGDDSATTNSEVLLSKSTYNAIGQLSRKDFHSIDGDSFIESSNYTYNPRGWLSTMTAGLFAMTLKYEDGTIPQYNGNVSDQYWGTAVSPDEKGYIYQYDKLNRLNNGQSSGGYIEKFVTYDLMGNITGLQRHSAAGLVDQLKYSYTGNILSSVLDSNSNASAAFQLAGTTDYSYDSNGRLISRLNSSATFNNLSNIVYNHLGLIQTLNAASTEIAYVYDASGNKLSKQIANGINTEYIGGIQYDQGVLHSVKTETGRVIRLSANNYNYEYTLKDHLGNSRVSFDINNGVAREIQRDDYYPFGLFISGSRFGEENKYLYNGKEKQEQEKMYDYGARLYDPVIGRWGVPDPLAELNVDLSPYRYCYNNPVNYIDPSGLAERKYFDDDDDDHIGDYAQGKPDDAKFFAQGDPKDPKSKKIDYVRNLPGVTIYAKAPSSKIFYGSWYSSLMGSYSNQGGGGATVYIENNGIGHAYIMVNKTVFSYGRYDGSYSPSSGRFGPIGKGVLLKKPQSYAAERMSSSPTTVHQFPNANADDIYQYMDNLYNSGTPATNEGRVINTYFLLGSNCTTITTGALQAGGVGIPTIQTPVGFNNYMNPLIPTGTNPYGLGW